MSEIDFISRGGLRRVVWILLQAAERRKQRTAITSTVSEAQDVIEHCLNLDSLPAQVQEKIAHAEGEKHG